jgi:hypothetical protein
VTSPPEAAPESSPFRRPCPQLHHHPFWMTAPLVVLTIGGSFALYSYLSTGNEQTYNNQGIIINLPTGPETRPKPSPTPLFRNTDPSYVTLFFTFWFLGTVTVGVYVQRGYKHDQSRGVNVSTSTTGRELMILCPGQLQLTPRYPRICRLILKSLLQYRPFRLDFFKRPMGRSHQLLRLHAC